MTDLGFFFTDSNGKTTYHKLDSIMFHREADGSCGVGIRTKDDIVMEFTLKVKKDVRAMPLPP